MRVTFFNNMITPYTNAVYNSLLRLGAEVTVISCTKNESNRNWGDVGSRNYSNTVLPGVTISLGGNRHVHINRSILKSLKSSRPDILVINGFYPSMLAGALYAKHNGIPLVLTIDGWASTMPNTVYHKIVRPYVLSMCRSIIVCGKKGLDYFRECNFKGTVDIVPLAPAWRPPEEILPLDGRPFHLLWAAQINNHAKNASFFVDVVCAANRVVPNLRVRIVGTGPYEAEMLGRLAKECVEFLHTPSLPWADMAHVFAQSRILLLPSLWEPWGLVCNEAMQCGTPCIVSPHVGAADDLVVSGQNGYVKGLDLCTWASSTINLLQDENLWCEMSIGAQRGVAGRDSEAAAANILKHLQVPHSG